MSLGGVASKPISWHENCGGIYLAGYCTSVEVTFMPLIHFEMADSTERTQIGEGLVRFAVQAGRLETGQAEGKYFLNHADGCDADGKRIRPGDGFCFDTETGDILCEKHGEERSERV